MMSQSIGTGRAFARDEKGGIAIIAAVCLSLMLGMSALAVDSAVFYLQKRKLQSATDLAAIAAASAPGNAQAAANATLARNGFATPAVVLVEYGTYTSDAATPTANRFVAQASGGNAIRLTTQINSPVYFSRVFSITRAAASGVTQLETVPANTVQINAKAIAMQTNTAAFSVGSRLLGLNGGLANAVLGSLLGTNVSLSLMDYQSLASANIDMFAFSRALATRLSLTGVSYDQLAATSVRSGTVVSAMADAVANNPVAVLALRSIATSIGNTGAMITIAPLVSFGPYGNLAVSTSTPVTAIANAMDMASAVAQISNGTRQVLVNLGASVPGLAAATLQLSIGARPVDSSLVAIGAQGSTLHTAQTRLLINASVGSAALGTAVSVPLYLELASANASLSTISCPNLDPTAASVGLSVTPAVLNASIGAVSASDFTNFTRSASVTPATLVTCTGRHCECDGPSLCGDDQRIADIGPLFGCGHCCCHAQNDIDNRLHHITHHQPARHSAIARADCGAWAGFA